MIRAAGRSIGDAVNAARSIGANSTCFTRVGVGTIGRGGVAGDEQLAIKMTAMIRMPPACARDVTRNVSGPLGRADTARGRSLTCDSITSAPDQKFGSSA